MKQIAYATLIATGLGVSCAAMAAGTAITDQPITSAQCALLADSVRLHLSNNVHGAWACSDENAKTIKIAACHEWGSRTPTDVPCTPVGTKPDGSTLYNFAECAADPTRSVTIAGPKAFVASSTGGAAAATGLDGGCSDESIAALDHFVE